jgi:hypothetical protein
VDLALVELGLMKLLEPVMLVITLVNVVPVNLTKIVLNVTLVTIYITDNVLPSVQMDGMVMMLPKLVKDVMVLV